MPRLRSIIRVLVVGLVGGAIGYLFGSLIGERQQELATAGFAFGALTEMWHITSQRRWFIVGLLIVLYIVSWIQGGIIALLAALGATVLTFTLSTVIVRHLYPGGEWEALGHHLQLALGMTRGFLVIQDGRITVPKKYKGPLYGPFELIVKPYHAAILEQDGKQTRIVGPTRLKTDLGEYVKDIIVIGRQQEQMVIPHVLSRDGIPVLVTLNMTYGIELPDSVILGWDPLGPTHEAILNRILLNTPDWKGQTRAVFQAATRVECSRYNLEQLIDSSNYAGMGRSILTAASGATTSWSVIVGSVMIEDVEPPTEITAAHTSIQVDRASGEIYKQRAMVAHDALLTLVEVYRRAIASGMTEDTVNGILNLELGRTRGNELKPDDDIEINRSIPPRAAVRLIMDRNIEEMDEIAIDELITTIAIRTRSARDDINLLYMIPGSVRLVLDMSDEDALRLLELYLKDDPLMGQFSITKVNVARNLLNDPFAKPLLDGPQDLNIESGLETLHDILQDQPARVVNEFSTLEARLRVVEKDIRIYGSDGPNHSEKLRAIDALNNLVSRVRPGVTFTDLCMKRVVQ